MYTITISVSAFTGMNGFGGHYFSALTTARELSTRHKVSLLVIGDFLPETLRVNDINIVFAKYEGGVFSVCPRKIIEAVDSIGPDILIAFDQKAGSTLRLLAVKRRIGFVQVKAGGPVPRAPLQNNPFQVHFSKKDYVFSVQRIKYKNKLIAWIPNRVEDEAPDNTAIEHLRRELKIKKDEIVLMRISRLDNKYERAFLGSINAAQIMREHGYQVRLIMIGNVTHKDLSDRLLNAMGTHDVLLTDTKYTRSARRLLGAAHITLGVGRGFMEGCAAGNYMLAMAGNSNIPVVATESNFHELFDNNFSLRATSMVSEHQRKTDLVELARNAVNTRGTCALSRQWFEQYFDSNRLADLYDPLLDAAGRHRERLDLHLLFNIAVSFTQRAFHAIRRK
ncbi:MAG: glycosyltransferase family protein [Pirellulaceae bacterium]